MLNVDNECIAIDQDGFLKDLSDWTPQVADALAERQGIVLSEAHWELLEMTRDFYREYDFSPNQRPFVKYVQQKLGPGKGNSRYLMKLFPGSPAKLASMISGIPKPSHCF